jgi:cytochrome c oxidase assembly factor CtaG
MKPAVAVALVIGAVSLIALPTLSDAWRAALLTRILERGNTTVQLQGEMGDLSRVCCWITGLLMMIIAVFGSLAAIAAEERAAFDGHEDAD